MRIGIAQIDTVPGAFDQTAERMLAQARRAAEQGADLVVFPLAALAGIELPSYADRPAYLADASDAVLRLADELPCPALVPVPIDSDEPSCGFDVLLLDRGAARPLFGEVSAKVARQGEGRELAQFALKGNRLVLALTYDDLDDIADYDYAADVIVYLSGCPFALDDPSSPLGANIEGARFVEDACASGMWLVGVGPVGGYGEEVFCGASFVLDPKGNLMAALPSFEEALQVVEVGHDAGDDRMGDVAHAMTPEVFDAPFSIWQAVCLGIHDFVRKQGATDVALVLDGTLASQVLLALASDALGPLRVHALVGAAAGGRAPACRDLARRLHVHQIDGPARPGLSDLDARGLDEASLASLAADYGALALSSLDKTALALGDPGGFVSCAHLLPLGDVYRTDVLDMAHVRNTISPLFRRVELGEADGVRLRLPDGTVRTLVGERALARVDEVLLGYVEYDRPLHDLLVDRQGDEGLVDAVLRAVRTSEAQRRALAPVLVMSTHTLEDARFPLGMSWHDEHPDGLKDWGAGRKAQGDEGGPAEGEARHADVAGEALQGGGGSPRRRGAPDVAGTLAMLRDLAEQGGFNPTGIAGAFSSDGAEGPLQSPGQNGWGSIFSEN